MEEERKIHSCLKKAFFERLDEVGRKRRRKYICRKSLLPLFLLRWRKLLGSGDECSFITMTGFSSQTFFAP
eukprot:2412196-Ditylum_brightwellii.AAC.1